jgi:hypothetical protein
MEFKSWRQYMMLVGMKEGRSAMATRSHPQEKKRNRSGQATGLGRRRRTTKSASTAMVPDLHATCSRLVRLVVQLGPTQLTLYNLPWSTSQLQYETQRISSNNFIALPCRMNWDVHCWNSMAISGFLCFLLCSPCSWTSASGFLLVDTLWITFRFWTSSNPNHGVEWAGVERDECGSLGWFWFGL